MIIAQINQSRPLTTRGNAAVEKLRTVLEEYRVKNFTDEIPSRFKKTVAQAAKEKRQDVIVPEGMERLIQNIGASHKITRDELHTIALEVGSEKKQIPFNTFVQMI